MYNLSKRSEARLSGVHPRMVAAIKDAITRDDCPEDFGIPEFGGRRSTEDQQGLYAIGRTIDVGIRKPVTYTDGIRKKSNHQPKPDGYGYAFDIYIYCHKKKRASWNVDRLRAAAQFLIGVFAEHGIYLEWGGNWKRFKDYPHFEAEEGSL